MAGAVRGGWKPMRWATLLLVSVAMLFCAPKSVQSQLTLPSPQSGSLSGKLTDLHSKPLEGMCLTLRSVMTGLELHAVTGKGGLYLFPALPPGTYELHASAPELGQGTLESLAIAPGKEAHMQIALDLAPLSAPSFEQQLATLLALIPPPPALETRPLTAHLPLVPLEKISLSGKIILAAQSGKSIPNPEDTAQRPTNSRAQASVRQTLSPVLQPTSPVLQTARPVLQSSHRSLSPVAAELLGSCAVLAAVAEKSGAMLQAGTPRRHAPEMVQNSPSHPPTYAMPQSEEPATKAATSELDDRALADQPNRNPHWQSFVEPSPASNATGEATGQPALGASQLPPEVRIDGASRSSAYDSGTADDERADPGANQGEDASLPQNTPALSQSAVRQIASASTNASTLSNHAAGGEIEAESQSGGNQLHGQAFFFGRQSGWGAQNPETHWLKNTGTSAVPVFTSEPYSPAEHSFFQGFGLGGALRRQHFFWFAALDNLERNYPAVSSVRNSSQFFDTYEPTTPALVTLSARLNESEEEAWEDYQGIPRSSYASAGLEQLASLLGPASRHTAQWVGFLRMDWQASEGQRITLEGSSAHVDSPGGGMTRSAVNYGTHSLGNAQASEQWMLGRWEHFLTPNLLATTQLSGGRAINAVHAETPSSFEDSFMSVNRWGQLPQIRIDTSYGFTIGNPARFGSGSDPRELSTHMQQQLDWAHGRLLFKSGLELDHNADYVSRLSNQTGSYSYSNVVKFVSDALAFERYGMADALNASDPHNCDAAGTGWSSLPCYSYYSQRIGPADWHLATNDWAGFAQAQWQASKALVLAAGLRWEHEDTPNPFAKLLNSDLPLTEHAPQLGNQWGPRMSMALGSGNSLWPVLRLGYGIYFARTSNLRLMSVLTQTGSSNGDRYYFLRPTDNLSYNSGGAPPFPYVLTGAPGSSVKPSALEFAPTYRNPSVQQAIVGLEEFLPWRLRLSATAALSLGRHLPISVDTNIDTSVNPGTLTYELVDATGKGPLSSPVTVPFYANGPDSSNSSGYSGRLNSSYQQIDQLQSRANSTYEAASLRVIRYANRGLSMDLHYTLAHAADWNPAESARLDGASLLDPANFRLEYAAGNLDMRHAAYFLLTWHDLWQLHSKSWSAHGLNRWSLTALGHYRSGQPYSMRVSGTLPQYFNAESQHITALATGMTGYGGDNRVYGLKRNSYRYPATWKADLRLDKRIDLGSLGQLELLIESFNLFNHQNLTEIESTGYTIESGSLTGSAPTLTYLTQGTTGSQATTPAFAQPYNSNATDFYQPRQLQFGLRLRFLRTPE